MFPCKDDLACGRAFEAYLKGLTRACGEHGKTRTGPAGPG
jgi:hypothetical protein